MVLVCEELFEDICDEAVCEGAICEVVCEAVCKEHLDEIGAVSIRNLRTIFNGYFNPRSTTRFVHTLIEQLQLKLHSMIVRVTWGSNNPWEE